MARSLFLVEVNEAVGIVLGCGRGEKVVCARPARARNWARRSELAQSSRYRFRATAFAPPPGKADTSRWRGPERSPRDWPRNTPEPRGSPSPASAGLGPPALP